MSLRVRALYSYSAQNDSELSFEAGEILHVINQDDDGWWEGEARGLRGLFPSNYVEICVGNQTGESENFSYGGDSTLFSSVRGEGVVFSSMGAGNQVNLAEYEALQNLQTEQLERLAEQQLQQPAWAEPKKSAKFSSNPYGSVSKSYNSTGYLNTQNPLEPEIEMNPMSFHTLAGSDAEGVPSKGSKLSTVTDDSWSGGGESFKPMKSSFKTIGFTWITGLGLFAGLAAFISAVYSLTILYRGNLDRNTFDIPNVLDYQVSAYVALYTLFTSVFTFVIEWFQMRMGDNGTCTALARASTYFGLALYMFLSYQTMPTAAIYIFVAIANLVYEYRLCI